MTSSVQASLKEGRNLCSLGFPQSLEKALAHRWCSINTCYQAPCQTLRRQRKFWPRSFTWVRRQTFFKKIIQSILGGNGTIRRFPVKNGPYNFILFSLLKKHPSKTLSAVSVLLIADRNCLWWCASYSSTNEGMANQPGKPEVGGDNGEEQSLGKFRRVSCGWRTRR